MAVEALAWTALFLAVLALGAAWFRARVWCMSLLHLPPNLTITLVAAVRPPDCEEHVFALGILTINISDIVRAVDG
jgi:hypothetical protein